MKSIKLFFWLLLLCTACNSNDDQQQKKETKNEVAGKISEIDSSYVKKYYPNSKVIQEEGLLFENKKLGVWKYYNPNGLLLVAKHFYLDTLVFEIDSAEFSFKSVELKNYKIKLKIPRTWEEVIQQNPSILFSYRLKCNDELKFCPNIILTCQKEDPEKKSKIDTAKIISSLKESFDKFRLINIENSPAIISATKITYIGRKNNKKLGGVICMFQNKGYAFNLAFLGDNSGENSFLKQKDIVDEIINSLELKD